ncbi:MAG: AraC-type DNA-binding protein [Bacilli bacterium]|nr:AraC-type DNA-binding protein [Bacilli bacterium]
MEQDAIKEHVDYQHPLLCFKIWGFSIDPFQQFSWNAWHYHKEVEIVAVLEGAMQVETVDRVYDLHEQSLLIVGSSRLHRTKRLQAVQQIVLQFDMFAQLDQSAKPYAPFLLELSEPLDRINEILEQHANVKENLLDLLNLIYLEAGKMEPGFEIAISGAIKQLLALFIRYSPSTHSLSHADWLRLKPVLDYVDAEYVNPIHIEDVLSLVHLEYHYFIKYFQKCIGMSFVDYLHFKRIKKAEHLLLTESLSIAEIGVQSGIPNNSQFIRIFKRYNECTPSQFRKNRIQIHVLPR